MYVERHTVSIITATGGAYDGYSDTLTGAIHEIAYSLGATGSTLASTADFSITTERDGVVLWSQSNVPIAAKQVRPRRTATTVSGITATNASLTEPVMVQNDRVHVVIAQGGNTKAGTISVTII
jgi:hypothetical protein